MIKRFSRNSPVLLLLDDLHWADEGTLLLLLHLAQLLRKLPVMIVGTSRHFEPDPAGRLARTLDELTRRHTLERVSLRGLSETGVKEMLRALSGHEPPQPIVKLFHNGTEGNPFFVEELFMHLREQGKLLDSGGDFRRDVDMDDTDVPQSLRLVIGRRLVRLNEATVKILGTAAVIGRSFTFDLLASATQLSSDTLLDCVEEAEAAGLITSTVEYPEARFRFAHELIRQAVVSDLSVPRRQRLHMYIANAIEQTVGDTVSDHAEDLAHHLWNAGSVVAPGKTIEYLSLAATLAVTRSANREAIVHLTRALDRLRSLPSTSESRRRELGLQLRLATALPPPTATEPAMWKSLMGAHASYATSLERRSSFFSCSAA